VSPFSSVSPTGAAAQALTAPLYPDLPPNKRLDRSSFRLRGERVCFLAAALVVGAASAAPGGDKFPELAGKCAKAILDAADKRKKLQEAARLQAAVRAQLIHRGSG
jgi:hypothetical protein